MPRDARYGSRGGREDRVRRPRRQVRPRDGQGETRAEAKLDALILRETFAARADDLETALVLVKDASERACASDALGRLLDIVVALSAILEKEKPKEEASRGRKQ